MIKQKRAHRLNLAYPMPGKSGILTWLHCLTRDEIAVFTVLEKVALQGFARLNQTILGMSAGCSEGRVLEATLGLEELHLIAVQRWPGHGHVYHLLPDVPRPFLVTRSQPPNDAA